MKVAIMQPYIFPYLGYFQLVNLVDTFVFYDDVNFIKKGFVNRNNLLSNNKRHQFTISCKKVSQNKRINEVELNFTPKEASKLVTFIKQNYINAPYFKNVFPLIEDFFFSYNKSFISQMAADSIMLVAKYLNIDTTFKFSSMEHSESFNLKASDRIIAICEKEKATQYINLVGGVKLYDKIDFLQHNIDLNFIKLKGVTYKQYSNDFVPWLSIIDVMMFNSIGDIKKNLKTYELL